MCLLAFTRGLLKPDYKSGQTSILAENLVLSALQREMNQNEIHAIVQMSANILGHSNLKSVKSMANSYAKQLRESYKYVRFNDVGNSVKDRFTKSDVDGMSKLFHAIKKNLKAKTNG